VSVQAEATERRLVFATAVYGALTIALVVVDWEGDGNEWHLVEVLVGYALTMWLTHIYAALVSRGDFSSWFEVAREEFAVAAAGLPAIAVALVGQLLHWDQNETADLALLACAVTLVGIQVAIVRHLGFSRSRLWLTLVVDALWAAVIITLHILI
jgi:heme/copper-type cytochrome/quinol oxidase subunit 4